MGGTAIIGLGAMGQGMARNIMQAGISLRGFDLSTAARDRFAGAGGIAEDSAVDAVSGCDLLLVMVATAAQAEATLFRWRFGCAGKRRRGHPVLHGCPIRGTGRLRRD